MAKKKKAAPTRAGKKKTSTALARRAPAKPVAGLVVRDTRNMLPVEPALSDDAVLGAMGLTEVKLTAKEEAALSLAVDPKDVLIKPTGQPYLSHPAYTTWFNRAFGRLGWALRPASNPRKSTTPGKKGVQIIRAYILYIHGKPVAFAEGEHEYYESNADQSYGDALEATFASALRRCAKRIGVGLELWDKTFLEDFKHKHCVAETVTYKDRMGNQQKKKVWRRLDQKPPTNVVHDDDGDDGDRGHAPQQRRRAPASAGSDGNGGLMISASQTARLWGIARDGDRDWTQVLSWLREAYGAEEMEGESGQKRDRFLTLPRSAYQAVCEAVGAPGPLPQGRV